jgi:hypothetical protein
MALGPGPSVLILRGLRRPQGGILHRTLLINMARQWKFALPGAHTAGKGPDMGRNAGSHRSAITSLLGA